MDRANGLKDKAMSILKVNMKTIFEMVMVFTNGQVEIFIGVNMWMTFVRVMGR